MLGVLDISMKERKITLMCFAKISGIEPAIEMLYVEAQTTTLLGECLSRSNVLCLPKRVNLLSKCLIRLLALRF